MKIIRDTPSFTPVTITLETIEECAAVAASLAMSTTAGERVYAEKKFGVALPSVTNGTTYAVYSALRAAIQESKCPPR